MLLDIQGPGNRLVKERRHVFVTFDSSYTYIFLYKIYV